MQKKQVASWIVAGVLVVSAGAALGAEGDPVVTDEVPTTTTAAPADTTTTVASTEETTTTVAAEETTTTVAEETTTTLGEETTTTVAADGEDPEGDVAGDEPAHGNSAAAQNHDCDEAWGNHGAWVSANAHAKKTGEEVSCDGPATATSTTTATATTVAADGAATTTATATHGKGHGKGKGK